MDTNKKNIDAKGSNNKKLNFINCNTTELLDNPKFDMTETKPLNDIIDRLDFKGAISDKIVAGYSREPLYVPTDELILNEIDIIKRQLLQRLTESNNASINATPTKEEKAKSEKSRSKKAITWKINRMGFREAFTYGYDFIK